MTEVETVTRILETTRNFQCPPCPQGIMGMTPFLFGWVVALVAGFLGAIVGLIVGFGLGTDAHHAELKETIRKLKIKYGELKELKEVTVLKFLRSKKADVKEERAGREATIDELKEHYPKYGGHIIRASALIEGMSPGLQGEFLAAMKKVVK